MADRVLLPQVDVAVAAREERRPKAVTAPTPPDGVTPVRAFRILRREQEISAIAIRPRELAGLERHNARIGRSLQRLVMRALIVYVFGFAGWLLLRILFRVKADHPERMGALKDGPTLLVPRHFYEIDPFISFYCVAFSSALSAPHLAGFSVASRFWTKNVVMRTISWLFGVMGLSRGLGLKQSATDRAVELLRSPSTNSVAIYPTGPLGERKKFTVGPGVGYIATQCPDVPVVPVTMMGLQEFRWLDLLLLRRPILHVSVCRPFTGRDATGPDLEARADSVCALVAERWAEEELRMKREWDNGGNK
jgi:1-acyl-sn-glycerol-3-phosphate acyltransferase